MILVFQPSAVSEDLVWGDQLIYLCDNDTRGHRLQVQSALVGLLYCRESGLGTLMLVFSLEVPRSPRARLGPADWPQKFAGPFNFEA